MIVYCPTCGRSFITDSPGVICDVCEAIETDEEDETEGSIEIEIEEDSEEDSEENEDDSEAEGSFGFASRYLVG